ncbi:hypothetical protein CE206_29120 (plasmid) [Achromobacter xylosoxidans]|uniref:hypothetical protein n=1 Tax=Alcaligenes xylosoxydans xylosoxydans TaxID=85698 RepID=UPI000DD16DE4|nr:hypothetical protein [Achromobacter xylosoxidans]AXA80634.1 hypothetical protein CE206_29120 [Achromobacter xylosoxidans]
MTVFTLPLDLPPRSLANELLSLLALNGGHPGTNPSSAGLRDVIQQENAVLMRCRQEDRDGEEVIISQTQAGYRRGIEQLGPDLHGAQFQVIAAVEDAGWTHVLDAEGWLYFYKLVDRDEVTAVEG